MSFPRVRNHQFVRHEKSFLVLSVNWSQAQVDDDAFVSFEECIMFVHGNPLEKWIYRLNRFCKWKWKNSMIILMRFSANEINKTNFSMLPRCRTRKSSLSLERCTRRSYSRIELSQSHSPDHWNLDMVKWMSRRLSCIRSIDCRWPIFCTLRKLDFVPGKPIGSHRQPQANCKYSELPSSGLESNASSRTMWCDRMVRSSGWIYWCHLQCPYDRIRFLALDTFVDKLESFSLKCRHQWVERSSTVV